MQQSDLRPAGTFAANFGCKAVTYGGPGSGKTPLINTAPRPVMLSIEPGMLSMIGSTVPTWEAHTSARVDEFFKWLFNSNEAKNFDTVATDSVTQMAENKLQELLPVNANKLKAYGDMANWVMSHLNPLYRLKYKHTYLIHKQETININGQEFRRPAYPGKELHQQVPHMFDFILHCGLHMVPGQGIVKAFRCAENFELAARDRTGKLAEYEPPHIGNLFTKAMS